MEQKEFPQANVLELEGEGGVQVEYRWVRRGEFFVYRDKEQEMTFTGEEISSLDTEIGRMHTVALETVPDSHHTTLTLIVPDINLQGGASSFATVAIRITHRTSIGGPDLIEGALQAYEVMPLNGRATQAD